MNTTVSAALPHLYDELRRLNLGEEDLKKAIIVRREAIRLHRDQKGDDRCWLDDYLVWKLLDDTRAMPQFSMEEGMEKCKEFFAHRNSDFTDSRHPEAVVDRNLWDADLASCNEFKLFIELLMVQNAILEHREVHGRPRTIADDRMLYSLLPEKKPADFRLPSRDKFLGEAKAPHAGCPSFWRSHANCPKERCDLHNWGPCVVISH